MFKTRHVFWNCLAMMATLPVLMDCQIRLPRVISDGVVLQRRAPERIWGWAGRNETVALRFIDSTYQTTADTNGAWSIVLPALSAGGPYDMQFKASDTVTIRNVLVGDVWVCSGQSNMELPMERVSPLYGAEIARSTNADIREFVVPQTYDFNRSHDDFKSGEWASANPETILDWSAVSYFFGKELYDKYRVPIGLINSSLGGSPIESWISEDALKRFPKYYDEAQRFKDSTLIQKIQTSDEKRIASWYRLLGEKDEGYKDGRHSWRDPDYDASRWDTMSIPGYWAGTKLGPVNGVVWFRRVVNLPASMVGKPGMLILGRIVDADSAFVNGTFVGTVSYQYPPRRYPIPSGVLREGENVIVVRVISNIGKGGFVPDKSYEIVVGNRSIDLKGAWHYRLGAKMESLPGQTFIRWKPLGLYNAMIAPLLNFRIKGVIWYQGESNADRPLEYRSLMSTLIQDWREKWDEKNFPFFFVQLPNFMEARSQPSESNWALLREAQLQTLSVPNTGMAVTVDIGEWNDIHPLDKKDVGERLALNAEKIAYGDSAVVASGPLYKSMNTDNNKILLSFADVGGGLVAKGGGPLKYFAIAGADRKFVWAQAQIEGDKVVVWSDTIQHPVAVRYAWADNPEGANLYNKEGLPASPFRTDNWEGR